MENPEGRRRDKAIIHEEKTNSYSVLAATVAAVAVSGPLYGLMSLSFLATMTLFLAVSPLMLIFVPVLTVTVASIVAAMVSVGVAAAMWLTGIAGLVCFAREVGIKTGVAERMVESVRFRSESLLARQVRGGLFFFSSS